MADPWQEFIEGHALVDMEHCYTRNTVAELDMSRRWP